MDAKKLEEMFDDAMIVTKGHLRNHNDCETAKVAASLVQAWATINAAEILAVEQSKIANRLGGIRDKIGYLS